MTGGDYDNNLGKGNVGGGDGRDCDCDDIYSNSALKLSLPLSHSLVSLLTHTPLSHSLLPFSLPPPDMVVGTWCVTVSVAVIDSALTSTFSPAQLRPWGRGT